MFTARLITTGISLLLLASCSPKIALMKPTAEIAEFTAPVDKALLVSYTRIPHVPGWNDKEYYVFVDGKLAGQMKQDSYFITEIEPGEHYLFLKFRKLGFYGLIMGLSKPKVVQSTAKIVFEPGKTYYLCSQYGGGLYFVPKTPDECASEMKEHKYRNYSLIQPYSDLNLNTTEIQQAVVAYSEKEKNEPERVKDFADYKGY
jgi:hypothetical protein